MSIWALQTLRTTTLIFIRHSFWNLNLYEPALAQLLEYISCSYFSPPCNGRPPTTGYTLADIHWCWNYTRVPFKASASSISPIKTTLVRDPFFEQLLIPALDNAIKPPHRPPVQSGVTVITPGHVNWREPFSMCNQITIFR